MKLRWKHFLILVAASLVPLLAVTWITQNASRRLGTTISVETFELGIKRREELKQQAA